MPLQSQVIPICVTQNSCFFGIFWEKMLSHGQTVHFWPHSVIHIRKAEHLTIQKIRLKFDFRHHVKRQICGDALQLIWRVDLNLYLTSFHSVKFNTREKMSPNIYSGNKCNISSMQYINLYLQCNISTSQWLILACRKSDFYKTRGKLKFGINSYRKDWE